MQPTNELAELRQTVADLQAQLDNRESIAANLRNDIREMQRSLAASENAIPLGAESVLSYLYALAKEASSRGGMFPQNADEHEADSDAIHRVANMVTWYANNGRGYPSILEVKTLMDERARNRTEGAASHGNGS